MTVYTIGHSTRTFEEFVQLLLARGVAQIADVRTIPRSRRHPHFSTGTLNELLTDHGVRYLHLPDLGGLRRARQDSPNLAWRQAGFRGYADFMMTVQFERGLVALMAYAEVSPTAVMCAEAVWWRCHRRLIADALIAKGRTVHHILSASVCSRHQLTSFARLQDGLVVYSGV